MRGQNVSGKALILFCTDVIIQKREARGRKKIKTSSRSFVNVGKRKINFLILSRNVWCFNLILADVRHDEKKKLLFASVYQQFEQFSICKHNRFVSTFNPIQLSYTNRGQKSYKSALCRLEVQTSFVVTPIQVWYMYVILNHLYRYFKSWSIPIKNVWRV